MTASLYANENFPLPVVEGLRRRGHDVLTIQETGQGERAVPDDEVVSLATRSSRAVLTLNRKDFIQLHRSNSEHAGIVACTFDPDFDGQAQRIHEAIETYPELAGHLIRVNRPHPSSQ